MMKRRRHQRTSWTYQHVNQSQRDLTVTREHY